MLDISSCFRWVKSTGGYWICGFCPFPHSSEQAWEYSQDVIRADTPDAHVPGFRGKRSREPPAFSLESSRGKNTYSILAEKRYKTVLPFQKVLVCVEAYFCHRIKKKKKKVIATFYLTFFLFWTQNCGGERQNCETKCHSYLFIDYSHSSEKKSQKCEIILTYFLRILSLYLTIMLFFWLLFNKNKMGNCDFSSQF